MLRIILVGGAGSNVRTNVNWPLRRRVRFRTYGSVPSDHGVAGSRSEVRYTIRPNQADIARRYAVFSRYGYELDSIVSASHARSQPRLVARSGHRHPVGEHRVRRRALRPRVRWSPRGLQD